MQVGGLVKIETWMFSIRLDIFRWSWWFFSAKTP